MTDKQKRFCEEYLRDFNLTQAAIRAGYSKDTAYAIGWENLRKPEIKAAIDERLKDLTLSSEGTLKSISDIARASLNDYFVVREVVRTPRVEKPLKEIIKEIEDTIEDEDKFIKKAKITNPDEIEAHKKNQEQRRRQIIKLQIELERNPGATQFVDGKSELVKIAELDVVKLVNDKEAGRIKSVKHSEYGLNVEMYSADTALRDLAKIHGLYEKHNSQKKADPISPEEVSAIIEKINKNAAS
jgi:phage terminase small subunit